jgi:hypothetical protein
MSDKFKRYTSGLASPARSAIQVTPSDSVDLETSSRALYIGGNGNVEVIMVGGQTITFNGILAGTVLPIRVTRVRDENTTANNIVALI